MAKKEIMPSDNPKPFKKGENGNRRGRIYVPPEVKAFNLLMSNQKRQRISPQVVRTAYEYLLGLPLEKVRDIAGSASDNSNKYPIFVRLAAVSLLQDGFEAVRKIISLIHPATAYLKIESSAKIEFTTLDASAIQKIKEIVASSGGTNDQILEDAIEFVEYEKK